jgi:hypothetical protein
MGLTPTQSHVGVPVMVKEKEDACCRGQRDARTNAIDPSLSQFAAFT